MASVQKSIFQLNLSFLFLAHEIAREDLQKAHVVFGLKPELAEVLRNASIDDLHRAANSTMLSFGPRGNQHFIIDTLKNPTSELPFIASLISGLSNS